ncbi:kinase-like domain-containing protein [Gigaspora rosea]|nr:kinase-like domain-containing protein [Gigaspora rosea]
MPAYVEPLYLSDQQYKRDKKSDIYSFGVILWEISSGRPPFQNFDSKVIKLRSHLVKGKREEPIKDTPSHYIKLYEKCWDKDPNNRPGINNILSDLNNDLNYMITKEQSKVIDQYHFLDISKWINGIDGDSPKQDKSTNLYQFELLIRGSRDGFKASKFHEKCDNKGPTLIVLKVKGTNEILGGYNHLDWNQKKKLNFIKKATNKSFIFALDKNDINNSKISRPTKTILSFNLSTKHELNFARDLCLNKNFNECKNVYKPHNYHKSIRDSEGSFSVEEYEVYQVIANDSN